MATQTAKKKTKAKRKTTAMAAKKDQPTARRQYIATLEDRYLDYPVAGLNPDRYTNAIRAADLGDIADWMELCEEMEDRDGQCAGLLASRRASVVACKQDIAPWRSYEARQKRQDADAKDKEVADFCRDQICGLPFFRDRQLDLLDANGKGVAFLNTVFKPLAGQGGKNRNYGIADLIHVPQRKMTYYGNADGQPRLLTTNNTLEGVPLRPYEWVIHAPRVRSIEAYRLGLWRILGWYFMFKHANARNWLTFLETHAHPLRIGVYAPGMSEEDKTNIWNALKRLSTDQAALVAGIEGKGGDLKSPIEQQYPQTREASESFLSLMDYCDKEIAKTINGQTLTSDADGKGSYALGRVHENVSQRYIAQDAEALCETIREYLIKPLVLFNYGSDYLTRLPTFTIDYQPPEDKQKLATAVGILSQQVGFRPSMRWVRDAFGIDMAEGADDMGTPQGMEPEPEPGASPDKPPEPAGEAAKRFIRADRPEGEPSDDILDALSMDLPPELVAPIAQYANTVDAWMLTATGNITSRVANYLKSHKEFASDEEFADEFMAWMDKGWAQYWAAGAMAAGLIGPYISAIYEHFKTGDMGAFPGGAPQAFTLGPEDRRFIKFINRSDRFFFSTLIDNQSYRGPMKAFLIDEYGKAGGKLWGETHLAFIEKFKQAAGPKAHKLSRYEVERIIKSTVSRGRNWARVGQFVDAGVEYGRVMNGGSPCPFCRDLGGTTVSVRKLSRWVESTVALDDAGFASALQERTDIHRAAVSAGTAPEEYVDAVGPPGYHPSCECTLVYER